MVVAKWRSKVFELGQVRVTAGVFDGENQNEVQAVLRRHVKGDWGEVDDTDKAANNLALVSGGSLLSAYTLSTTGDLVYVYTDTDHKLTTILLPSEYESLTLL